MNGPFEAALFAAICAGTGVGNDRFWVVALSGMAGDGGVVGLDACVRREAGVFGSGTEGMVRASTDGTSTS